MTASRPISSVVLTRYSGALIDLAEEAKAVDKVRQDLMSFADIVEKNEDLAHFIRSPLTNKSKQVNIVTEIAKKSKFHDLTQNFLCVLAQNRRLANVVEIVRTVEKMIAQRQGVSVVGVTTAVPMSEPQKKELQTKIAASLGHDVALEIKVDPAILGGMIVTIGSRMIDDSVRRKLERLNVLLTQGANTNTVQTLKEVV